MSDDGFLKHQLPTMAGMAGAIAVRSAISKAYQAKRGTEPPVDPGAEGATWRQAILWTAVLAAGAGVGRLLARYAVGETVDKRVGGTRELAKA
ncbi:DUF4235 domain-containing protein [Euzebya sp.]|uniref:DUF4235 domain-containing protein n=1 Tax=Euzebya sp. TaxID=1971409 RepID=UPI0035129C60